jgi:hypothetical protein
MRLSSLLPAAAAAAAVLPVTSTPSPAAAAAAALPMSTAEQKKHGLVRPHAADRSYQASAQEYMFREDGDDDL